MLLALRAHKAVHQPGPYGRKLLRPLQCAAQRPRCAALLGRAPSCCGHQTCSCPSHASVSHLQSRQGVRSQKISSAAVRLPA